MSNTAKRVKVLSDSYVQQINILKVMSREAATTRVGREFHINEIASQSGLNDERETQRCLYILEGQKLVTPLPPGDFTSKTWQITKDGLRALNTIVRSAIQ
jgi:hypothetical protein